MKVHELAIFWRSVTTRCFTSWHFLPGSQERAADRAAQMLALLTKCSRLQIYGAALDGEPLLPPEAKTAPARGTEVRLQVDLYPAKPLNPKAGITYLKFSIPGPTQAVIDLVERQRFQHRDWQALKREIFAYLCLPDGTSQKKEGSALYRAEIVYLDLKHQPQPDYPPLAAAIARTTEDLNIARASFNKLKTEQEKQRVEKYQKRLDTLYTWEYLEKDLFEQRESLCILQAEPTEATAPAVAEAELEIEPSLPLTAVARTLKATVTAAQPSTPPVPIEPAPATPTPLQVTSNNRFNGQAGQKGEAPAMTETTAPHATQPEAYLPVPPALDQAHAWQDVAPAQFQDASMWLDRNQIKQRYQLSERSFFRWIDTLRSFGLTRWLSAQGKPLLRLYYRRDLELAVAKLQTASETTSHQGRPRKGLAAVTQGSAPAPTPAAVAAIPAPQTQPSVPGQEPATLAASITPQTVLPSTIEISHFAAALIEVQTRCSALEQTVMTLQQRCDSLAAQLQHQAQAQQQVGKDEILAAIDKLARKILRTTATHSTSSTAHKAKTRAAPKPARARTSAHAKTVKPAAISKKKRTSVPSKVKAKITAKKAHKRKSAKKSR
jgi:hypothetical protein